VVCQLGGEDAFLDSLPAASRDVAWRTLAERAGDVDRFVAPSRYFADLMGRRLNLSSDQVRGRSQRHQPRRLRSRNRPVTAPPSDFRPPASALRPPTSGFRPAAPPVLGYFARMCHEKGLDTLVEAYLLLRQRDRVKD